MLPTPGQAACRTEAVEMPVRMVGSRAVAAVGINGTAVPLTVDSGAFYSFLTDAAVAQLELPASHNSALRGEGISGKVETRITIDADAKNASHLDSRGWAHLRMGNYKRARADFDRSIELKPDSPWSLYGRGLTRAGMGGAAQGESDLLAARKLNAGIDELVKGAGLPTDPVRKP